MLIQLNDYSKNYPFELSLSHHVFQVVNKYPCRGEWRPRLCTQKGGTSTTSAHDGPVQHCCNLCKSTKLNITQSNFFFKDLDSHPLSRCTTSLLYPELYYIFTLTEGRIKLFLLVKRLMIYVHMEEVMQESFV